jgi:myo-inositol-1(or 4)-monophosphatase
VTVPDPIFLTTATEIVLRAGEIQMARRESGFRVDKKGTIDLVTEVDLECERMCRAVIAERFPDHDILAEELSSGPGEPARARYRWVFDPLDGTTNYAHGLPIFCSSLGLELDGHAIVGAVYDPTRRELFTAERGKGAFLNGAPLTVSRTPALLDALLVTGFPYDVHTRAPDLVGLFGAFLARARAVRRLGSAALDLCYVAAGRFEGFWEQYLKPWDVAAGALIVSEAGGRVTGMDGTPFDPIAAHLVASNGQVHDQILAVIRDYRRPAARS